MLQLMKSYTTLWSGYVIASLLTLSTSIAAQSPAQQAEEIINATGVQGGFIIHIGSGDGQLTQALRANDHYMVHGLDSNPANVRKAREAILSSGEYGSITIDHLTGTELPIVDNLVNLVVSEDLGDVPMNEIKRILAPQGVAYIRQNGSWQKTVKPTPDNVDEWTHFYHGADGNAVAHDTAVGPPRHLQWIGSPRWSRHHDRMASMSALVSTAGRLFYIMDEGSRISIQLPPKWALIGRDAYNGTVLWKRSIDKWQNHLWPLKSGPSQLARRLVAKDDRVYVTLSIDAPVTALNAATGETEITYKDSKGTEEILLSGNTLYMLVNDAGWELKNYFPFKNTGDQGRVAKEFAWNEKPRTVLAAKADTGEILWKKSSIVAPISMVADANQLYYYDDDKLVCHDGATGDVVWTSPALKRRAKMTFNFGPRIVVQNDTVVFAGGDGKMTAFATKDGKEQWSAPHAQSAYQSPEDLLVVGGLVWSSPNRLSRDSGVYTGRDILTGEVKREFAPDVSTYWFHHRCYIAKATDKYLIPSRTGVEFVDPDDGHWDINHWVRGGCLYGTMPCNGLIYTPPHNCACYPETKLYGFNALAPLGRSIQAPPANESRFERGPAYEQVANVQDQSAGLADWPTYRYDVERSSFTRNTIEPKVQTKWTSDIGDRLSSISMAQGKIYVADVNTHRVQAIDAETGNLAWSFQAGGRVDSAPTYYQGKVLFGSADGWVYCVRATDGALAWRFRAAPLDLRLTAFEQLESVWPVHGSILVQNEQAYFVAGRSNFLDGGLRMYRLDANTGSLLSESVIDELDPETGENLQARLQILNMPAGLPDILSGDGDHIYMRSQKFDHDGNRMELNPVYGNPVEQGSAQQSVGRHVYAPMGFLDDTWFHRSYWVYGKSFAGGHAGYYQAGKFTPSGRILVFNDSQVFGFGRKPQYLKWTTIMEHQLFAAPKEAPVVDEQDKRKGSPSVSAIRFEHSPSLDPTNQAVAVEAWINSESQDGVILARGGGQLGYALTISGGSPKFIVRTGGEMTAISSRDQIVGSWTHLVGALTKDRELRLYVNGDLAAVGKAPSLITKNPQESLSIGADDGSTVGDYTGPGAFMGIIDEVKVYHGTLTAKEIEARFTNEGSFALQNAKTVLDCTFDRGDAVDISGYQNHGLVDGIRSMAGKKGKAMRFMGRPSKGGLTFVNYDWTQDIPLLARAMLLANDTLFVAGPPDIIDEEESFKKLSEQDPLIQAKLAEQDTLLDEGKGARLWVVSTKDGSKLHDYPLPAPPVWDGMIAAQGKIFMALTDGSVIALGAE